MSFTSRRELLTKVWPRYREATRKQKTYILNEFIASTGYKRKYAIRMLSLPEIPTVKAIKRARARFYGEDVQEALKIAWCSSNCIASKRLSPFLAELVPALEHHGHLELSDEVRHQLISISPATIDRILKPCRSHSGRGTTKRGSLLKHQVPVRTFADWEEKKPGFFEADLVAHCGWSMEGSILYTLTLTDITTTWTECLPLLYRGQDAVLPPPAKNSDSADNPEVCFKGLFESSAETENSSHIMDDVFKPETRTKRKYRKTKKTRVPHWWRTRSDPFEHVNDEISASLEQNPERTAKSILQDIQKRYPEKYTDGQLRTLQRRVKAWRAQALISFDDSWIQSDKMSDLDFPKQLRGETPAYTSDEIHSP